MDPVRLNKLLTLLTVGIAIADTVSAFRWLMTMVTGEAGGVPADIALVLNFLDAILVSYVAYHYFLHRDDMFWASMTEEGRLNRNLFLAAIIIGLFAPVVEKAAML